jgi:TolA-binding protein
MKVRHWLAIVLLMLMARAAGAADKNLVELRRDIALLNDRLRAMQSSIEQNNADSLGLLRQAIEKLNDARAQNAAIQSALREERMRREQAVASLDSKLGLIDNKSVSTGNAVADLSARLRKMDQTLADVDELVHIIQMPPPAPPGAPQILGGPPPGMTAESLFASAMQDQAAGQNEQASREFREFLKYFDRTELTAAAQYHLGEIALSQGDADSAIHASDLVLEQYPKSSKAADAHYLKAKALEKAGRRSRAIQELNRVVRGYAGSEAAKNAQADLRNLRR